MAEELEVKEITELNGVSFTDSTLILAYTEDEGVGKTTFADAKANIGSGIDLEQTTTASGAGAENVITATIRNGTQTETKIFSIKNGTGLTQATQTESTDADGLRSNAIALKSSDTTLVDDIEFTVKDGVGIKAHSTTEETDTAGLRKNTLAISLTDGTSESIEIKDGVGVKAHSVTEETDDNGRTKNTLAVTYTDGTADSIEIKDGVGIKTAHQTVTSTDDGGTNKFTITLTDGQTEEISIKNGSTGTGATVETAGLFGFHIDSGNLVLTYSGETAPSLALNTSGELIYTY